MSRDHFQKMELQHDAAAAKKSDGMLNQFKVYFSLRAFSIANYGDRRIEMIPAEDVLQEAATALLELGGTADFDGVVSIEWNKKNYYHARNAIRRLCGRYGFGARHRKEKSLFSPIGDDILLIDILEEKNAEPIAVAEKILALYESGMTLREICDHFGVQYTHSKQTAMNRLFPRNIGHGGKRKNSGRKKLK